jgi:hypothetical protein
MRRFKIPILPTVLALGLLVLVVGVACSDDDDDAAEEASFTPGGNGIVVALRGTDTGEMMEIPATGAGTTEALCFTVDLVDLATGDVIGDATDCLADLEGDGVTGLSLIGTTTFNFPDGTLVSRGTTTVQPVLDGSVDYTHITGAVPVDGENSVLSGTGVFEGATGQVRLSGAVNMSELDSDGKITFDCVFVISVEA